MHIRLRKPAGVSVVKAECDVFPSDTHAFDMLYPERPESRRAAERFCESFNYAKDHYFSGD